MVRPGVVTADRRGVGKRQEEAPSLTLAELETICKGLANYRGLKFDPDEHPKLSCILPDGHRFECLVGPSVQTGVSLAIRCKHPFTPSRSEARRVGKECVSTFRSRWSSSP